MGSVTTGARMKKARSKPEDSIHSWGAGRRAPKTAPPGATARGGRGTRTAIGERDYTPRPEAPGVERPPVVRQRRRPAPRARGGAARLLAAGFPVRRGPLRGGPRGGPAPRAPGPLAHGLRRGGNRPRAHRLPRLPRARVPLGRGRGLPRPGPGGLVRLRLRGRGGRHLPRAPGA